MMPRRRTRGLAPAVQLLLVAALAAAVALTIVLSWSAGRLVATTAAPHATDRPVPPGFFRPTGQQWRSFTLAPVHDATFANEVEADGEIAPPDDTTTQVLSPFSGRITRTYVTVGDVVHTGEPLFSGEGDEFAQAENDLRTAGATLRGARVQLAVTRANRRRLVALLRADGAARKDVEQSAADLATALAAVRNAETAEALARSHVMVLGAGFGALGDTSGTRPLPTAVTVRAPVDGVVTQRAVGVGQNVESAANGASTPLLTIVDTSHVFFVADVTETQIPFVRPGERMEIRLDAFPDRRFDARVAYVGQSLDPAVHRIAVRGDLANPDGDLKPGMFGRAVVLFGSGVTAIDVPEDAVIFEADTARVWIAGPDRTLALRAVRTGKIADGRVEVLSGLHDGDRVVTSGSVFIDRAAQDED